MGTFDCQTSETMRRQFNLQESAEYDIGMKEMMALKLLVQNITINADVSVIRIHCDNMRCVYAYENYGCKNQKMNEIIRFLFEWQLRHHVRIEIEYVSTHDNLADAPSREIDIDDELCVTPMLLRTIELRFRLTFTLDCCASSGTQITRMGGHKLKFCSRYKEDDSFCVNYFNLPFHKILDETVWIFCPRKREAMFIDHFLQQKRRPRGCILLVQHEEFPTLGSLLHQHCQQYQVYRGRHLLQKPNKKRASFVPYRGHLTLYIFFFDRKPAI